MMPGRVVDVVPVRITSGLSVRTSGGKMRLLVK
jgi:hypothetical protein